MRQQNKAMVERFMTAYHASFHDSGSSISNPITISDSPPLPSTFSNPSAPTSPPISFRTRSHDPSIGLIRTRDSHLIIPSTLSQEEREQEAERLRPTCEHKYLFWWETHVDGIVEKCERCYQLFKKPFPNSK